ncbi:MAG: hypothetical protein LC780_14100 [Acidobacteria bacterium]|nr:hypothetical protein [Acidobacteriota bacterium]
MSGLTPPSSGARTPARAPRPALLLGALVAMTAAAKLVLAWRFPGFLTGDDLEIVQTAAKYALGVEYHPWELRCLFHPLALVWPALKLAAMAGARDPALVTWVCALPNVAVSSAGIVILYALARRWEWPVRPALAAAFLYAFAWMPLAYGATPYPRPMSATALIAAFWFASARSESAGPQIAAGFLAAAAFAIRWSEGVVLVPLLAWSAWRFRSPRGVIGIGAGFVAGTLACVGLVDQLTWGAPFASLKSFVRIMWLEIPAARRAIEEPFPWYLRTPLQWGGPILLLLAVAGWTNRRGRAPLAISLAIVLGMSLFAHKEWRYLQCAIPFLCLAAAAGWERLYEAGHRRLAAGALLLCVPYAADRSLALLRDKTSGEIEASRRILAMRPAPRVLAFEQMWAYGERLYFGNAVEIREIELHRPLQPAAIRKAATGADVVGVYSLHLDRASLRELASLGFRPIVSLKRDTSYECMLFGRREEAGGRR